MRIHFIAIGGAIMHQLALALLRLGHNVTGSDDEIFDPSLSVLAKHNLLPESFGWYTENITDDLDLIILGMHAKGDNPELLLAQKKGIPIQSFAEFVYSQSQSKKRVVIGGSHGKTTITSMVMHVLKTLGRPFDYLVGARLDGFDQMVQLTDAPIIVLEGDEYLSSAIEMKPKFHFYRPHVAVISGIAWDHMNVFPTEENYLGQFRKFIELIEDGGSLIACKEDEAIVKMTKTRREDITYNMYSTLAHEVVNGQFSLIDGDQRYALQVFGAHNMQNLSACREVCKQLEVSDSEFFEAITSFKGAARRLERVFENDTNAFYIDFAHAPSKVKATTQAMKDMYPERKLVACFELHTYSSLNKDFLQQYEGALKHADEAIVFYDPHTLIIKKLPALDPLDIINAFGHKRLAVFTDAHELEHRFEMTDWENSNFLLMTSGKLGGLKKERIATFMAAK